jgi:PilZ domain-containing protein
MTQPASSARKERRTSLRAVSRLKARCQVSRVAEEGAWVAMVRNISCQGIGLVVNRPAKPGMRLIIELPTNPRRTTTPYLIRVTRVEAQAGNREWYIGGTFAKKLTQLELNALQARTPTIIPHDERRTTVRHTTRLKNPCPVVRTIEDGPWMATVRNVSPRGVGLIAQRPFKVGAYLTIELPTRSGKLARPRLLKVTHASRQADSSWWTFGGMFLHRLTAEEYAMLL